MPSGVTVNNAIGRLVEAETDNCGAWPPVPITDEWFSYTARGEVSDLYASTPHSGGYYHSAATYWPNGVVSLLTGAAGYWAGFNVDGEGRIYSMASNGALNGTTYNAASQPTQVTFSSADSDSFTYDPNTGRMTQYKFNVNGQSVVGNLTWNANGTLQTQNITDPFNTANTQNCSYGYDDVSRLTNANCGSAAAQTFSFDAFGNINKSGSPYSFQPSYSSSSNRMTSIGSCTPAYDGDGNVTNDCLHTYSWNSDGRPTTIDSVNLTYDAFGRMVEQNRSGTYSEMAYAPTGQKIEIMNGQSYSKAFVPLPGGAVAEYVNGAPSVYFRHPDHLGSSRFVSTGNRSMYSDTAYAPFGEPYAQSGTTDLSFTGQNQDTVAGLYDFPAREYSIQGRWPSPDPAGLAAVDPSNPQSWNRYAYVMNNPLALTDPDGLDPCQGANNFAFSQAANGTGIFTQDDCNANGGSWGDSFLNGPGGGGSVGNGPPGPDTTPGCISVPNPDPFGFGQPILNCNTDGSSGPGSIASGKGSPSPTWAAIKTFFTPPSTGPGSCIQVALDAAKGPLDTARSVAQNAQKYAAPAANALSSGSAYVAINLNNMLRARQLDPFLGPAVAAGASTVAAGLTYVAAGVTRAVPYIGVGLLGAADVFGSYAVIKEGIAAVRGTCKP